MDLSLRAFLRRFWSLLERYLPTHSICSLPFVTSFCLGMGTRRVCYGQVRGSRAGWPGARGFPDVPHVGEGAAFSLIFGPHLGPVWGALGVTAPSAPCPPSTSVSFFRRRPWGPGTT